MAESYLGGHSLHRDSWFGRSTQPDEVEQSNPDTYIEVELAARALNPHYRASPLSRATRAKVKFARSDLISDFLKIKIELSELVFAYDAVGPWIVKMTDVSERISRLSILLRGRKKQLSPKALRVIAKVESKMGGFRRADAEELINCVLTQLNLRRGKPRVARDPAPPRPSAPDRSAELLSRLRALAPAAFCDSPQPLAIGIHRVVRALFSREGFTSKDFSRAFHAWTSQPAYQRALVPGATRIDLDGRPCGLVTPAEVQDLLQTGRAGGFPGGIQGAALRGSLSRV
jgi:hypothetical protein